MFDVKKQEAVKYRPMPVCLKDSPSNWSSLKRRHIKYSVPYQTPLLFETNRILLSLMFIASRLANFYACILILNVPIRVYKLNERNLEVLIFQEVDKTKHTNCMS